jgi:hypothetical protein
MFGGRGAAVGGTISRPRPTLGQPILKPFPGHIDVFNPESVPSFTKPLKPLKPCIPVKPVDGAKVILDKYKESDYDQRERHAKEARDAASKSARNHTIIVSTTIVGTAIGTAAYANSKSGQDLLDKSASTVAANPEVGKLAGKAGAGAVDHAAKST